MLGFPPSTEFNKRIPKQKFYENAAVPAAVKRLFADQLRCIYWRNKLAVSTLNLTAGERVTEIEIFELCLTGPKLDEAVLRQIDSEIPYHILFVLSYENKVQAWISCKDTSANSSAKVSRYLHTDWMPETELSLAISGLSLEAVYDGLVRQIARLQGENWNAAYSIAENIQRSAEREKLQKQIAALENANHAVQVAEEVADCAASVIDLLDSVYSDKVMLPENARSNNVELKIDPDKLAMPEFKALWNKISPKSVYVVDFDTDELVQKSIRSLNRNLNVSKIYFKVESGEMTEIKSKDSLLDGSAFAKADQHKYDPQTKIHASQSVKYDLIGKLVAETKLTRKAIVQILVGIEKAVFDQFKDNPEEFILKAAALINDEKATAIIQHITYNILDEHYDTDIFTEPTLKGKLGTNVIKVQRHLYDHLIYDSSNERDFAADLDTNRDVAVYVKLPDGFYISTPVGKYNPDWAIAFYEGTVKHIYFVAETKGTLDSMKLNHITPVEQAKIDCARAHFKALNDENVVYDVVSDYQTLLNAVMK